MKSIKLFKILLVCFTTVGIGTFSQINAQEQVEVSDAELDQIASAYQGIQKVNMEAQQKVVSAVEDSGFDTDRFNELYQASTTPEKAVEATDEEKEKFGQVMNQIQQMQVGFQKEIEEIIVDEGISMERYQTIAMALQTDTKLQQRLQSALSKQQN